MREARTPASDVIRDFRSDRPARTPAHRNRTRASEHGGAVTVDSTNLARTDLLTTLRTRRSTRFFAPRPIGAAALAGAISAGLDADADSWPELPEGMALEVDVVAFRVDGIVSGLHRFEPSTRSFVPLGQLSADHKDLTLQTEFCDSAAIISIAVDLEAATALEGTHGYRMLLGRVSAAAYTMWLDGVAQGMTGSVFAGFIPAAIRGDLHSDGTNRHHVFALALGQPTRDKSAEPPT